MTRRRIIILVSGLCLLLGGCAMLMGGMMPAEIKAMGARTEKISAKILRDSPQASQRYQAGTRSMHYVSVGAGDAKPLVIFVHGSPGEWEGWADYLADPDLAARAHLIAVDRPGFGESGGGKAEKSLLRQAQDIAPLLDQAAPGQRVILVGHSFGGPLIARLAMDYGPKISDLIILAGSIDPALEETKWYQYPADWRLLSWMVPKSLRTTNREIMALKPELEAMLPLWPRITQRVTVIQGEKDDLVPAANADFAKAHLTKAQKLDIIRLPGVNHFLPWNHFALVKQTLLKHMDSAP